MTVNYVGWVRHALRVRDAQGNIIHSPHTCEVCLAREEDAERRMNYKNPLPVVVGIVKVLSVDVRRRVAPPDIYGEYWNLMLVERGKEGDPGFGKPALPGGYINENETYQEALIRELKEELNVDVRLDQVGEWVRVYTSKTSNRLIIAASVDYLLASELPPFIPNPEARSRILRSVTSRFDDLAFPIHVQAAKDFGYDRAYTGYETRKDQTV